LTDERSARLWKRTLPARFSSVAIPAILRNVTKEDIPALGDLFHAAFLGTVDDGGLTQSQYTSKATAILSGRYGEWLAQASWTIEQRGGLRSACLVSDYKPYGCPVIAIVATAPAHKRSGDGGVLLDAVLASLTALAPGYRECCAMVTVGNLASERLFQSRGFLPDVEH
jgi:hypothetical protein